MQPNNNNSYKDLSIDPLSMPSKRAERTQPAKKKRNYNEMRLLIMIFAAFIIIFLFVVDVVAATTKAAPKSNRL